MKRFMTAAVLLIAGSVYAQQPAEDCSNSRYHFDGKEAHVAKEVIEAGNLPMLEVSKENAPLSIVGGNASGYTIIACKAAAQEQDLDAIRVSFQGGRLQATGPRGRRWSVAYKIEAPRGGDVRLKSVNGPVSVRDYDGTLRARSNNGPLSLTNVSGSIEVTTNNGPVKIAGASGSMKVNATNGPLSLDLSGSRWEGEGLDAVSENGPVSVKFPSHYGSAVVAEALGRGPISCKAAGCERFSDVLDITRVRSNGEPRRIELGSGAPAVRVTAHNGPLTIREQD